ncbi:DUF1501 domain-containing protein [Reyranella sp.]|uniref:DUF1501 domain-containing protein n=1 Tax=Reyranella sp. TaxID=1929291 RepID=UPI003BA8C1D8
MGRILLLVELKGGNDGLNTIVPYADPRYRELRPGIAVAREQTIQLDEATGLNGKLEPLMESWKAGDLAIVQGVGYPAPNRSHFRSIEIWDTASSASQTLGEGWIAQAFKGASRPSGPGVDSIVLDSNALPSTGPALRTIVMRDAENFLHQARALKAAGGRSDDGNPALRHLLAVRQEINAAAQDLSERLRSAPAPAEAYPEDLRLGRQFDLATRLLAARVPVVALKGALGGFDTHANQAPTHERLLSVLAANLALLRRNLIAAGCWDEVVVATYSEFGRRAAQNASAGTDHGTAAPMLVMGGGVKGGLHGAAASLADLEDGDLRHTVDFRDVFATLARGCWGLSEDFGVRSPRRLALFGDA